MSAVGETAKAMILVAEDIPSVNSLFLKFASKFPKRPSAPSAASIMAGGPAGGGMPSPTAAQFQQAGPALGLGLGALGGQPGAAGGLPGGAGALLAGPAGGAGAGGLGPVSGMMMPPQQAQQMQVPVNGMAQLQMPGVMGMPGMLGGLQMPGMVGVLPQQAQQLMVGQQSAGAGGVLLSGPATMLAPSLQQRICNIVASSGGAVRPEHFDAKVVNMMQVCVLL